MSTITLHTGGPNETVATLESVDDHGVMLFGSTEGNLYIEIDGVEYGSLFFEMFDGKPRITFGQYDAEEGGWAERNPITEATNWGNE